MRYLALYRPATGEEGAMPSPEHMAEMGRLVEEMTARGALIRTEPLAVRAACAVVRRTGATTTVEDAGERMGGYAFLEAPSREAAIELARRFLEVAGDGTCEIRQVVEMGP